jgi:hypothetical protein
LKGLLYEEWVPAGRLVKALTVFSFSLILCVMLMVTSSNVATRDPSPIFALGAVLAFLSFLFWNYRGIRIEVNSERLMVHYGLFNRKRIPMVDIVSCEPDEAPFRRYGGVGVRYGIDGSWAYTTSLGEAVRVTLRRGRPFVFSSNSPMEICSVIDQVKSVQ